MPESQENLAFEILVRENSRMLLVYLRSIVQDESAIDDLYQETMMAAWRSLKDFDRSKPFAPWLRGIAHKLVLAYYRKHKRRLTIMNQAFMERLDQQLEHINQRTGNTWEDKVAAIHDCLNALPGVYQGMIKSRYLEELPTQAIASQYQVSHAACRKRLQRARGMLASCLKSNQVLFSSKGASQ